MEQKQKINIWTEKKVNQFTKQAGNKKGVTLTKGEELLIMNYKHKKKSNRIYKIK